VLLHNAAQSVADGKAIVSNALRARGQPTEFPISPESLDHMTEDLRKIAFHLSYRHLGRPMPYGLIGQDLANSTLRSPWLYKHPTPRQSQSKTEAFPPFRKRVPKQPRPPPSSRG
jgi:hypothetical protein